MRVRPILLRPGRRMVAWLIESDLWAASRSFRLTGCCPPPHYTPGTSSARLDGAYSSRWPTAGLAGTGIRGICRHPRSPRVHFSRSWASASVTTTIATMIGWICHSKSDGDDLDCYQSSLTSGSLAGARTITALTMSLTAARQSVTTTNWSTHSSDWPPSWSLGGAPARTKPTRSAPESALRTRDRCSRRAVRKETRVNGQRRGR